MNLVKIIINVSNSWKQLMSFLMKTFLKINGAKIGKHSYIDFTSRIVAKKVIIGKDVRILENVKIKASEIIIGDGVVISDNSYITGNGKLQIGYSSYLGKKSRINLSRDVIIGNNVGFGENSVIWTHGYFPPADEGYPVTYASVCVKDRAWVSTNIIILPGVTIGADVIVGAGSVVTKSLGDAVIIAGNPARVIKNVETIKKKVEFKKLIKGILYEFLGSQNIAIIKDESSFLWLKYERFNLFIVDGLYPKMDFDDIQGEIIFLCQTIKEDLIKKYDNIVWFDFVKKTRKRSSLKLVSNLHNYFRSYGMRFLIEE